MPRPSLAAGQSARDDRSDRMHGRRTESGDEQQDAQPGVARRDAQQAHRDAGDGRRQDHQVAQVRAVGQVADERLQHGRPLQKDAEQTGLRMDRPNDWIREGSSGGRNDV